VPVAIEIGSVEIISPMIVVAIIVPMIVVAIIIPVIAVRIIMPTIVIDRLDQAALRGCNHPKQGC
jgi:hypothetical protein